MVHKIKEIAREKHLSVAEVERLADITERTINRWDSKEPSVYKVYRVAKVLGTTVEDLLSP